MDSAVKARPNHYETLGLTPKATAPEIARAFALNMSVGARSMTAAAQLTIAYETLKDPARRRAYDETLGLTPKPAPVHWTFATAQPRWAPFIASATPGAKPAAAAARPPEPHVAPERQEELPPVPKPASLAADAEQPPAAAQAADPWLEPPIPDFLAQRASRPRVRNERAVDWKYPAFALGSLVLGVVILGAWAGTAAGGDAAAAQAEPALTAATPEARQRQAAPIASPTETQTELPARTIPEIRTKRVASPPRQGVPSAIETAAIVQGPAEELAGDPLAPQPAASEPTAASLPLPNRVIARTIGRIGYACGEVASATPLEGGAPGAFRVTCTSGYSYQATPVRGRYRFRRLASR